MTSKFKCPFCGKSLWHTIGKPTWSCQNWDCLASDNMIGNHTIWEKLIQTQKDLEIAKSTLDWLGYEFPPAYPEKNVIAEMRQKARNALKKIEHKD